VLEQDGHQVTVAKKAQQALKEVTTNNNDVILLDVQMPGMSGMEFYHLLMGSEQSHAEKVIFITGDVVSPETQQFLSEVKRPLINKPIDIQVLKQLVSRQIRASKKRINRTGVSCCRLSLIEADTTITMNSDSD